MLKQTILVSSLALATVASAVTTRWAGQESPFTPILVCDVNGDGQIDTLDLALIRAAIGSPTYPGDPRDANGDGKINISDVRICSQRCTKANCAVGGGQ